MEVSLVYHMEPENIKQVLPRHKVLISYNGTPQIQPQNCPSCIDDNHPSNTSIPQPTPLTIPNSIHSAILP